MRVGPTRMRSHYPMPHSWWYEYLMCGTMSYIQPRTLNRAPVHVDHSSLVDILRSSLRQFPSLNARWCVGSLSRLFGKSIYHDWSSWLHILSPNLQIWLSNGNVVWDILIPCGRPCLQGVRAISRQAHDPNWAKAKAKRGQEQSRWLIESAMSWGILPTRT